MAPLLRPVRCASDWTNASILSERRILKGADFVGIVLVYTFITV